jgi:hypothetical protein
MDRDSQLESMTRAADGSMLTMDAVAVMCGIPRQTQEQAHNMLTAWQSALAGLDAPVAAVAHDRREQTRAATEHTSSLSGCQNMSLTGCSWPCLPSTCVPMGSFGWAQGVAQESPSPYLSDAETVFSASSSSNYCSIELGDAACAAPECTTPPAFPVHHNNRALADAACAVQQCPILPAFAEYHNCGPGDAVSDLQECVKSPAPAALAAAHMMAKTTQPTSKKACSTWAPKNDLYNIAYYANLRKKHAAADAPVHVDWLVDPVDVHGSMAARTIFCDDDFTLVSQYTIFFK